MPGTRRLTLADQVVSPNFEWVEPRSTSQLVNTLLYADRHLGIAETPECAGIAVVCENRFGVYRTRAEAVRTGSMLGCLGNDGRREGRVGAGIGDDVNLERL
jgi:hypothetical protein